MVHFLAFRLADLKTLNAMNKPIGTKNARTMIVTSILVFASKLDSYIGMIIDVAIRASR